MRSTIFFVLTTAAACSGPQTLEPATGEIRARSDLAQLDRDTIVQQTAGITIKAEVDAWPGSSEVLQHVTPVRVTIENRSQRPVQVQYRRFQLLSSRGERANALPPFQVEGSISEPALLDRSGFADPWLRYPGFRVDPIYSSVWPGLAPYDPIMDFDPTFYRSGYAYWTRPLPTPEMLRRVMPEGVLEPGGSVSGFLYFEKLGGDARRAQLVADLRHARSGERIAVSRIPFLVEEG